MTQSTLSLHTLDNETDTTSKWYQISQMLTSSVIKKFMIRTKKQSTAHLDAMIRSHILEALTALTGERDHTSISRIMIGIHCISIKDETNVTIMNFSLARKSQVNAYDALAYGYRVQINNLMKTVTTGTVSTMYGDVTGNLRFLDGKNVVGMSGMEHTNITVNLGALLHTLTKLKFDTPK